MDYEGINTSRHDELIEDAKAELRVQTVTARTLALTSVGFSALTVAILSLRGEGALHLPLTLVGIFAGIAASMLILLTVLMYGIGVSGAKHSLARQKRRRDIYVLMKMGLMEDSKSKDEADA